MVLFSRMTPVSYSPMTDAVRGVSMRWVFAD